MQIQFRLRLFLHLLILARGNEVLYQRVMEEHDLHHGHREIFLISHQAQLFQNSLKIHQRLATFQTQAQTTPLRGLRLISQME